MKLELKTERGSSPLVPLLSEEMGIGGRVVPSRLVGLMMLLLTSLSFLPQNTWAHEIINHQTIMDYAGQKAAALPTPLIFGTTQTTRMHEGAADEDSGARPLNHAYNPMTGGTFPLGTMNARDTAAIRWSSMSNAFFFGNLDGGDDSGAWHFLGRTSHLLQDMTSPLHSLAIKHLEPTCQFEKYWQTNDLSLRSALATIGGPLQSSTLDPKAVEKLDALTTARLQDRFNNSSPNKNNDDPRGWLEVMVWITYFRSTFWGEITMSSSIGNGTATASSTTSTTFSDGTIGAQANALQTMFGSGNVRWVNNFIGDDYYEITDRSGNVFRFMSFTDVDDWAACGEAPSHDGWSYGQKDSSIRINGSDDDDDSVRVTGRESDSKRKRRLPIAFSAAFRSSSGIATKSRSWKSMTRSWTSARSRAMAASILRRRR